MQCPASRGAGAPTEPGVWSTSRVPGPRGQAQKSASRVHHRVGFQPRALGVSPLRLVCGARRSILQHEFAGLTLFAALLEIRQQSLVREIQLQIESG